MNSQKMRLLLVNVLGLTEWQGITLEDKSYAKTTVRMVNTIIQKEKLKSGMIVELGCGLGDIISNIIPCRMKRVGIDIKNENIIAARILNPWIVKKVSFIRGSFEKIAYKQIDFLIIVNVLHNISPKELRGYLVNVLMENDVRYIVIDEVRNGLNYYKFEHNGEELFSNYGYEKKYISKKIPSAGNAYRRVVVYSKERLKSK